MVDQMTSKESILSRFCSGVSAKATQATARMYIRRAFNLRFYLRGTGAGRACPATTYDCRILRERNRVCNRQNCLNLRRRRVRLRLSGFDYSQPGAYFVTLCTHRHVCLFGQIRNSEMPCNRHGMSVAAYWDEIPDHYPYVVLDAFAI